MKTKLYPWQQKAVDKLLKLKVGALYMEQGTGKTRTTLELVGKRLQAGKVDIVLWLCPCSVKGSIKEELRYHFGDVPQNIIIRGIESLSCSDRLYLILIKLVKTHRAFLVVDESNLVKNDNALRTKRIIELAKHCKYKLILNGTPVTRNEADLFSQWYILDWRILGYKSFYSFAANHLEYKKILLPDGREVIDYHRVNRVLNTDYLTEKIAPYTYQIKKEECMELPPKKYEEVYFELDPRQRSIYEYTRYEYLARVDEIRSDTIYKLFAALQHVASGREVVSRPEEGMRTKELFSNYKNNPRMVKLKELIEKKIGGAKCIVFAKYQSEIDEIGMMLDEMRKNFVVFTGKVTQKQRQKNREVFQNGDTQFFLANRQCASYGLNLQFCHKIVYYSNDFDWGTRAQSEERIYRLGQEYPVTIFDIIATKTIDEFIRDCLLRKERLTASFKREIEAWKETIMTDNVSFEEISSKKDPDKFYAKMGPFFASKTIRKDFGSGFALSNEDNYKWIVATKDKRIIGFIYAEPMKRGWKIRAIYTSPEWRRHGLCTELLKRIIKLAEEEKIKAISITQRDFVERTMLKLGFEKNKKIGKSWLNFRKELGASE